MAIQRKKYHCDTPELIIQKSLEMFNTQGERQITTKQHANQSIQLIA